MRRIAIGSVAVLFAALSVTLAASGGGETRDAAFDDALAHTAHQTSQRYKITVRMTHGDTPLSLHIRGQANRHTVSVKMRMGAVKLPDGTKVPGPNGAALLNGPFLYERAPSTIAVYGSVNWLRLRVHALAPSSDDVKAVRSMTPAPILDVLDAAAIAPAEPGARVFHGTIAYDDPSVRAGLARLTGGIEFRGLRVSAMVGRDGLVHRVVLTGRTPDGKTMLSLRAHLYAFGTAVHVTPPAPGTFMDDHKELPA